MNTIRGYVSCGVWVGCLWWFIQSIYRNNGILSAEIRKAFTNENEVLPCQLFLILRHNKSWQDSLKVYK
ncbi:hypothetical protein C1N53_10635 [Pontibacter sp. SGAir0037]|nr:hypothetical protein C1N53_10635 [Pontibacter sp. SGAir0037]